MRLKRIGHIAAALILTSIGVQSQTQSGKPVTTTLHTTADAIATAVSDQTEIIVEINSEADTTQQAVDKSKAEYDRIVAVFRKRLGKEIEIEPETLRFPDLVYNQSPRQYVVREFRMLIKSVNFPLTSRVIDAITEANARTRVMYTSSNEAKARAEAVGEATRKAREKAEAMASALGMNVLRVVSAEEVPTDGNVPGAIEAGAFTSTGTNGRLSLPRPQTLVLGTMGDTAAVELSHKIKVYAMVSLTVEIGA